MIQKIINTMQDQLSFELPLRIALDKDNYFISRANHEAVVFIENWMDWPQKKLVLVGPSGSGKTHLSNVWAGEVNATILDAAFLSKQNIEKICKTSVLLENIDQIVGSKVTEEILFYLHNLLHAKGKSLLMTSRKPPSRLNFLLPDVQSRLQGASVVELKPVDDDLLVAMLVKNLSDRQMNFTDNLLSYVLPRIERSYSAVKFFVEDLDVRAMAENRPIGKRLAKEILDLQFNNSE